MSVLDEFPDTLPNVPETSAAKIPVRDSIISLGLALGLLQQFRQETAIKYFSAMLQEAEIPSKEVIDTHLALFEVAEKWIVEVMERISQGAGFESMDDLFDLDQFEDATERFYSRVNWNADAPEEPQDNDGGGRL